MQLFKLDLQGIPTEKSSTGDIDKDSTKYQQRTVWKTPRNLVLNVKTKQKSTKHYKLEDINPHIYSTGITEYWAIIDISDAELGMMGYVI